MNITDLIGYSAGLIIAVALTPQVIQAWQTKSTKDISLLWNLIAVFGLALHLAYGFLLQQNPIIITSGIEILLVILLISAKLKYR